MSTAVPTPRQVDVAGDAPPDDVERPGQVAIVVELKADRGPLDGHDICSGDHVARW